MHTSAHVDDFSRKSLPSEDALPNFVFNLPALKYGPALNCVSMLIDRHIENGNADKIAICSLDENWTYQDLDSKVNQIANYLVSELGVVPGNRVLLRFPNSPLHAACLLAVWSCGAIAVPTMPLLRKKELQVIVAKAEIDHVICQSDLKAEAEGLELTHLVLSDDLESVMSEFSPDFDRIATASDDVALISFTSGTTGNPKGVLHFHRDIISMCHTYCQHVVKPTADDIFIGSPPLAFTFGLGGLLIFPLFTGATAALIADCAPLKLAKAVKAVGATLCFTAPTAYKLMLSQGDVADLSTIRLAVSAGEHLALPIYEMWQEKVGVPMIDGLGATEMIHIFLSTSVGDPMPGSTGKAVPGFELQIVDKNMKVLQDGEEGHLAVRGPTGCKYLNDHRQAEYVSDGWNLTGDIFRRDEQGYYWYVARGDDMIISSGYNISGPEVEVALLAHPAVLECAVIAAKDVDRGSVPKAFIILNDGYEPTEDMTDELQKFVKNRIAPFKYPRQIAYLKELPKTATGKLQRFLLQQ